MADTTSRKSPRKGSHKRNRFPVRILLVGIVLLLLITLAAVRLHRSAQTKDTPVSEPEPVTEEPQTPEPEPTPSTDTESKTDDTELDAEAQRAAFLPDYTSAPLLDTTSIRDLSLEVGAIADELRLNWLSPSSAAGKVQWTDTASGETKVFEAQTFASTTVPGYYVNKASVTGLTPSASYTYQVGNDDGWSPAYTYQAPADNPDELTFLVTADAQIGQSDIEDPLETAERWDSVVNRLTQYVPEANFLLHVGDQVSDFGSEEHYGLYLNHLPLYRIALAPVVGNHDVANDTTIAENGHPGGQYFYEHFNVPNRSSVGQSQYDKDGNYYFIRNQVLFIILNSSTSQGEAAQEQYVAQVVAEHPDTTWRILAQHYSAYPGTKNTRSNCKEYLARIAADNDIDLVLGAHDHRYSRTAFVNRDCETYNDYDYEPGDTVTNPEGTLYVTCGTSSGCLYHFPDPSVQIVHQEEENVPVAIRFDVTNQELHFRTYLMDSWTVCDEYTIRKE